MKMALFNNTILRIVLGIWYPFTFHMDSLKFVDPYFDAANKLARPQAMLVDDSRLVLLHPKKIQLWQRDSQKASFVKEIVIPVDATTILLTSGIQVINIFLLKMLTN